MQHIKAQIYATLIGRNMTASGWARDRGYNPRTVLKVIQRMKGNEFRDGSISSEIASELLEMIGENSPRTIN